MSSEADAKSEWVERVLGYRASAAQNPTQNPASNPVADAPRSGNLNQAGVRLAQGLLIWNAARRYASEQITALQQVILKETRGEPDFKSIEASVGSLDDLLESLDDSLGQKLGELRETADPARKAVLSSEAVAIVERFQAFVAEDSLMNDIDDNGFMPLDIKAKITAALAATRSTI